MSNSGKLNLFPPIHKKANLKPFKAFESTHAQESSFKDIIDEEEAAAKVQELPDDRSHDDHTEDDFDADYEIRQSLKRKKFDYFTVSEDELNIVIPLGKKKSKKS